MFTVKVTGVNLPIHRQIPGKDNVWGDYKFYFNEPSIKKCDYWIVMDDYGLYNDNEAIVPPKNVFLVMGEAEGVQIYKDSFVKQFPNIVTVQNKKYPVKNTLRRLYIAPWFVGFDFGTKGEMNCINSYSKSYDELKNMELLGKTKLMSIISSDKAFTEGHRRRLEFAKAVKDYFGDQVDFYGRGIRTFSDKWDVLCPYKYHIAVENYQTVDYITEKLYDAFLGQTYPLYYGAPNVCEYFPKESLTLIDINDIKQSINIIEQTVNSNIYEKHLDSILYARELALDKYNAMHQIIDILSNFTTEGKVKRIILRPACYCGLKGHVKYYAKKFFN